MRLRIAAAAFCGLMFATPLAAGAQVVAGTLLDGTINGNFSSNHAYAGQQVTVSNVTSDSGGYVRNGRLYGYVSEVQRASQGRPGRIAFRFTKLVTGSGAVYAIDSRVTQMKAQTKSNAAKEAGGALAGMLVGNALGKTLFGASGGGVVGAAGGFLLARNNRQDINVPDGSWLQVELLSVTRRQAQ
jgi:hypothetical protein